MFLFFIKLGKVYTKNHGTSMIGKCSYCDCEREWSLFEKRKWAMIMFIPFTYDSKYSFVCNECRNSFEIYGEQVMQAKKMIKNIKKYKLGKLNREDLVNNVNHENHIVNIDEPDTSWECPYCKNVNPNAIYKCRECGYKLI